MSSRSAMTAALALGALVLLEPEAAVAVGPKSTASATASADIIRNVNLTETYELAFGLVKSNNNAAGAVVVSPAGVPTRSPGGGATTVGSGPCQTDWCEDPTSPSNVDSASYWGPGIFTVTGSPGLSYRVSGGAPTATAYWRTPAIGRDPALQVNNFTFATKSSGYSSNVGTLDGSGNDTVRVGGTLQVLGGMKTASYRVHVPVTIQYN